jgi:hypothetical protein
MNLNQIKNYYLDLRLIKDGNSFFTEKEIDRIFTMYHDMLSFFWDGRPEMGESYYHTLDNIGVLRNVIEENRSKKLDELDV